MFNILANAPANTTPKGSGLISIGLMVAMFALMYFIMIRPQKKRQKQEEAMRNSLEIGDEVITIGGFYGRVVAVKDDNSIVIESVVDGSKQKLTKSAIQTNLTVHETSAKVK